MVREVNFVVAFSKKIKLYLNNYNMFETLFGKFYTLKKRQFQYQTLSNFQEFFAHLEGVHGNELFLSKTHQRHCFISSFLKPTVVVSTPTIALS